MKLIIVESPTKAKTIRKFVPDGFNVMASAGHIMEIPHKGLNINIEDGSFTPNTEVISGKENIVEEIKEKSNIADEVFIATDCDREGEKISIDIANFIEDKSKIRRSVFHEITKKAILKAIENPRMIDLNMVNSQVARQVIDRLIGYLVSPMLWDRVPGGKSAGRVQSVALRIIAEREAIIKAFVADKFWDIPVKLKFGEDVVNGIVITSSKNRFSDKEKANAAKNEVQDSPLTVQSVDKKTVSKSPNPPFDTASLQTSASTVFSWSVKQTMDVAQSLFEKGCTSYHRTDSFDVNEEAQKSCLEWIEKKFGKEYLPSKPNIYKKKTLSQEAHECIRPTSLSGEGFVENSSSDMTSDEKILLDLIKARFISSQMKDSEQAKTTIIVSAGNQKVLVEGNNVVFDGWNKAWKVKNDDIFLPKIKKDDCPAVSAISIKQHETRPPERFNEGSLVKRLEKEGVGRPSTYANMIESLSNRGYVTKDGKNFVLTDIGKSVFEFLMKEFESFFLDIGFTAKVEEDLDKISDGKEKRIDVIKKFYEDLEKIVYKEKFQALNELFGQYHPKKSS